MFFVLDENRLLTVNRLLRKKPAGDQLLPWLELFISALLKPEANEDTLPDGSQAERLHDVLSEALVSLRSVTYQHIFKPGRGKRCRRRILEFHRYYVVLLHQIYPNQSYFSNSNTCQALFFEEIFAYLQSMVIWMETDFPEIRRSGNQPSFLYLNAAIVQIKTWITSAGKVSGQYPQCVETLQIVKDICQSYFRCWNSEFNASYRGVEYLKRLLNSLAEIESFESVDDGLHTVDIQLIRFNFNHPLFAEYLLNKIQKQTEKLQHPADKIAKLTLLQSLLRQTCCVKNCSLDEQHESLEALLSRWVQEELARLKLTAQSNSTNPAMASSAGTEMQPRLKCNLSIDQLALIFRAAEAERIIESKSLSAVFRSIAPFISTNFRKHLSADSMRSKCYNAEPRDIKNTIETLEQIILKIRDY
ncbi:hypothetical protein GCM10027051_32500 [Niabella terrae]